ncbi:MAG TPA: DUF2254 domain-containing protein [Gemmatimonadales bacterium]|nr:DUF2254 domain-containing protein [Gemmatimonadales bacterium]
MPDIIRLQWQRLRGSLWFLPTGMAAMAAALAFILVGIDRSAPTEWLLKQAWVYSGGADGASAVLQTIAGSMITIAGVVFSLTLVALTLASSQFGPRLLRNFMRDTTNQVVLGTFVSTFLYCLLVLRTIRHDTEALFVPHLSVTFGLVFALASLWVLIYFIHHVSTSIQADSVIARVAHDLTDAINAQFPLVRSITDTAASDQRVDATWLREKSDGSLPLAASRAGYLQWIDLDRLTALAESRDLVLQGQRRVGQYLIEGGAVLLVQPGHRLDDDLTTRLRDCFRLGDQRSDLQDVEFAVHQLVEVAVRALSPGINDPFTAISCVDRLGAALGRLATRPMPSGVHLGGTREVRLVMPVSDFEGVADAAFNQIRQYARTDVAVTLRLLEVIAQVAAVADRSGDRDTLRHHADRILAGAEGALPDTSDRETVRRRHAVAVRAVHRGEVPTLT